MALWQKTLFILTSCDKGIYAFHAEGWYAVGGNVSLNGPAKVNGDVNLILTDNTTLTAASGINVPQGSSLTVWCQSGKSGALTAGGIGGAGAVTINGGSIASSGGSESGGIACSTVTVNRGSVTATGNPGIGNSQGTVSLSWTDSDDSIEANSYAGTVTLAKAFIDEKGIGYNAGRVTNRNEFSGKKLSPHTHSLQHIVASEPSFDPETGEYTTGAIACWACDCGRAFSDEEGKDPLESYLRPYYVFEKNDDGTARITAFYGPDAEITVPDTVPEGLATEAVPKDTPITVVSPFFVNYSEDNLVLKKVVLGDNISEIQMYAFECCPNLEEIEIGSGLRKIEAYAFNGCNSLKSITCTAAEGDFSLHQRSFDGLANVTIYGYHSGSFRDAVDSTNFRAGENNRYIGLGAHTYSEQPTWTWAENFTSAQAQFKCDCCDEVTVVDAQITSVTTVQPTYFKGGSKTHTASVTIDGNTYTDVKTEELPALTGDTIILSNAADWEAAAASINNGIGADKNYKLADDYNDSTAVTTPIGTETHPFTGTFDGNFKTLNVNITDIINQGTAPFRYIAGATIENLTVTGSVKDTTHAAGLVGFNLGGSSTIENCIVKTDIVVETESDEAGTYQYIGGVVGHSIGAELTLKNVVFDGTICNDFLGYVGGLVGWNEDSTLTFDKCLFHASYEGYADFHPVACKKEGGKGEAKGAATVYSTQEATLSNNSSNYVGKTGFTLVEKTQPSNDLYQTVQVANYTAYIPAGVTISGLNEYYTPASVLALSYVLKDSKGSELTKGTDYTVAVSPEDLTEEGMHTLTFTGAGAYSGSITRTFEVRNATQDNPITDTLTRETTGVTSGSTTYTDWSGKIDASGAVYAGNSAGGNNAIQIRSKNSDSGIITTDSGGLVSKVSVKWNDNNNQGGNPSTLYIYGKDTAYTSPADFFDSEKQGTRLGTLVYSGISIGELTIDGDYPYIGLCSASGAIYLNEIGIEWKGAPEPVFKTHTLLLSGQIGVNFYMDLSMLTEDEREAATMEFTVNGKTTTDTFDTECMNPSTKEYYGFTCYINSVQMADEITAVLHYTKDGREGTVTQTYSAKEYVDHVLEHTEDYSANAVALVSAIADYGHYVQPFLADHNGWTVDKDHAGMDKVNTFMEADVEAAGNSVADMAIVRDVGDSEIEKVTYSLNLESETAIRIYLKVKEGYTGEVTATMGGKAIACTKQNDGRYRIEIGGISAHKLGDVYNITVSAGGEFTIKVSALSYVNTVLTSEDDIFDNDIARYAVTAIYKYYVATMNYKNNPND